jgi:hypothetical protein
MENLFEVIHRERRIARAPAAGRGRGVGHVPPGPQLLSSVAGWCDRLPSLRSFATSFRGDVDRADDLVREALRQAWAKKKAF